MTNYKDLSRQKLKQRGVEVLDIATLVYDLQKAYHSGLTIDMCIQAIEQVLDKREVAFAVLTGIEIDMAAEKKHFKEINCVINDDYSLYGIDEILALSIVNVHGSIALTNFGYLDKTKPGIIGLLEEEGKKEDVCHTFLDDIVCAIASSAASRLAHKKENVKAP